MNKNELKKLRDSLPPKTRYERINSILARQGLDKLSNGSIRNILSGFSKNDQVILAAYEVATSHKRAMEKAKAEFSKKTK